MNDTQLSEDLGMIRTEGDDKQEGSLRTNTHEMSQKSSSPLSSFPFQCVSLCA